MQQGAINRNSKLGCLLAMRDAGFNPAVVIDVGAQTGTEALVCVFPAAKHLMIEPVAENEAILLHIAAQLKDAEVLIVAADAASGESFLHVSPNTRYAAVSDNADPRGELQDVRRIDCVAVDDLCQNRSLTGPFLLKIDVDGKELDVLMGSLHTLGNTECVIVETVFFGDGANNFHRVVGFMQENGFVVYDILEPVYRPIDLALWQVDTVFVKRDSLFRRVHRFADKAAMKTVACK
ncbi:MAG: FkbM family methyltransferase [Gammaproteobacteria bacterium]|nr:FkbM family methyltransferase [Gammaproteobacteria bacterium]